MYYGLFFFHCDQLKTYVLCNIYLFMFLIILYTRHDPILRSIKIIFVNNITEVVNTRAQKFMQVEINVLFK